jgi:hypothetical protein
MNKELELLAVRVHSNLETGSSSFHAWRFNYNTHKI